MKLRVGKKLNIFNNLKISILSISLFSISILFIN